MRRRLADFKHNRISFEEKSKNAAGPMLSDAQDALKRT
jgi:hypothetical protein